MGTCIHPFVCRENPNRVVPRPDTERASPEQCSLVALCGGLGAGGGGEGSVSWLHAPRVQLRET